MAEPADNSSVTDPLDIVGALAKLLLLDEGIHKAMILYIAEAHDALMTVVRQRTFAETDANQMRPERNQLITGVKNALARIRENQAADDPEQVVFDIRDDLMATITNDQGKTMMTCEAMAVAATLALATERLNSDPDPKHELPKVCSCNIPLPGVTCEVHPNGKIERCHCGTSEFNPEIETCQDAASGRLEWAQVHCPACKRMSPRRASQDEAIRLWNKMVT